MGTIMENMQGLLQEDEAVPVADDKANDTKYAGLDAMFAQLEAFIEEMEPRATPEPKHVEPATELRVFKDSLIRPRDEKGKVIYDLQNYVSTGTPDTTRCSDMLKTLQKHVKDLTVEQVLSVWELHSVSEILQPPSMIKALQNVTKKHERSMDTHAVASIIHACHRRGQRDLAGSFFGTFMHKVKKYQTTHIDPCHAASCLCAGLSSPHYVTDDLLAMLETNITWHFKSMTHQDVCNVMIFFHGAHKSMSRLLKCLINDYLQENMLRLNATQFYDVMVVQHGSTKQLSYSERPGLLCEYMQENVTHMDHKDVVKMLALLAHTRVWPPSSVFEIMRQKVLTTMSDLDDSDYCRLFWAVCKLNIWIDSADFVSALIDSLGHKMQNLDQIQFFQIVYSLCILCACGHDVRAVCSSVQQLIMQIPTLQIQNTELSVLHQFVLSLKLRNYPIVLSDELQDLSLQYFTNRSSRASGGQKATAEQFRMAGFRVQDEVFCPDTKYSIDMQLTKRGSNQVFFVEYNGPVHYVRNQYNKEVQETGSTMLKRWHMTQYHPFIFKTIKHNERATQIPRIIAECSRYLKK